MPFNIIRNDITKVEADAIVNAANTALFMGGGVCGAIFRAAGIDELQAACDGLAPIKTGEAVITPGFALPAKYIIHTAGPVYRDGTQGEEALLQACYMNSLALAVKHGCESIAFPLISSGIYGYPKAEALRIATDAIRGFIAGSERDIDVSLVIFGREEFAVGRELLGEVESYIDEHYVGNLEAPQRRFPDAELGAVGFVGTKSPMPGAIAAAEADDAGEAVGAVDGEAGEEIEAIGISYLKTVEPMPVTADAVGAVDDDAIEAIEAVDTAVSQVDMAVSAMAYYFSEGVVEDRGAEEIEEAEKPGGFEKTARKQSAASLEDLVGKLDEPFSATLLRLIDATGEKDSDIYHRANIDRKLFSKIRTNSNYMPSKATVLAFAVALELTLEQTADLLRRAGFALSHSHKFDVIVEYFIANRKFNIFDINEVLFYHDQPLLGGKM